ncbi:DUF6387 family protein [Proteus mirabilis]|uniref:DUF6387 family protein n=1 Tax=Proteus mirabilis TaxID=584 RepID=UPI00223FD9E4|nr:DUF6387 family protein [Proteus mirabilis]UZK73195.1 DUF6387 family protein [Proteus mirabilis]
MKRKDNFKWFDLKKYDELFELNDEQLLFQLIHRRDWYRGALLNLVDLNIIDVNIHHDVLELYNNNIENRFKEVVRPLDSEYFHNLKIENKKYSDKQLSLKRGVSPLRLIDVKELNKLSDRYINEENIFRSLRGLKRSVSKVIDTDSTMHVKLNLEYPDEIIIEDIKGLLKTWRIELGYNGVGGEIKSNTSWDVTKRKIFDYKIFPIIDLMCWEKFKKTRVTNKKIASLVFVDGEYDSTNIVQTIKPFIENLMSNFSIEKYQSIFSSN